MSTHALETRQLVKRFGGLTATGSVSFTLEKGSRHALIGPNGAGKTTFINLLTGVLRPTSGSVLLNGEDISSAGVHERVRRGLVRTFQINQLFPTLSVLETLGLALSERAGFGWNVWQHALLRRGLVEQAAAFADTFLLADVLHTPTSSLSYGKQRLLEIAVAIASQPKVLLLDEPAAGVPEHDRAAILDVLAALPRDVSVVLIEHDMDLVFSFADVITVLVSGSVLTRGPADRVSSDPRVKAVYLGEAGHE
ncbi:ABC transporter ATP-binding protein [Bradyrhizobium sp. CB2312]|uniref:ABC transporter ATP-binding protein n=1 Tax=Bradyrhizobium sp. CB2312 TaxID=3039155 RepID=UPI0024B08A5C|nr:ABC transporter ATP-binding protein [Bradyrhizobium sp. CB2312]WFU75449.1 ABC transporter ATP-binding protein [Bradyrhizobium sp. CB2312]